MFSYFAIHDDDVDCVSAQKSSQSGLCI